VRYFGIEKAAIEPSVAKRLAYRLFGEIHISGRIRLYHVLRAIASLQLPDVGVRMLDAGTGRGDVSLHFARLKPGWRIHGLDIESDRVAHCRAVARQLALSNVTYECRDLLDLNETSTYDLITNTDVLEHIEDDLLAVRKMAAALAPGGYLLMTFPADPGRRHLRLLRWIEARRGFARGVIGHVREGYSPDRISSLLHKAQLHVESIRYTYGFFGTLAHDLFFIIGDSEVNPVVFALSLPLLLPLSFLEGHTRPRTGSALLVLARKPV
jgi:SAM-dependent methyltransferase